MNKQGKLTFIWESSDYIYWVLHPLEVIISSNNPLESRSPRTTFAISVTIKSSPLFSSPCLSSFWTVHLNAPAQASWSITVHGKGHRYPLAPLFHLRFHLLSLSHSLELHLAFISPRPLQSQPLKVRGNQAEAGRCGVVMRETWMDFGARWVVSVLLPHHTAKNILNVWHSSCLKMSFHQNCTLVHMEKRQQIHHVTQSL